MKNLFTNLLQSLLSNFLDFLRLEFSFFSWISDMSKRLEHIIKSSIFLVLLASDMLMPTHAAEIPSELFGYYEADSKFCAEAKKSWSAGGQMGGILIRKEKIVFIESTCSPSRIIKRGAGSFTLNLSCFGEGDEWKVSDTYTINGKVLTISGKDGEEKLWRCW